MDVDFSGLGRLMAQHKVICVRLRQAQIKVHLNEPLKFKKRLLSNATEI